MAYQRITGHHEARSKSDSDKHEREVHSTSPHASITSSSPPSNTYLTHTKIGGSLERCGGRVVGRAEARFFVEAGPQLGLADLQEPDEPAELLNRLADLGGGGKGIGGARSDGPEGGIGPRSLRLDLRDPATHDGGVRTGLEKGPVAIELAVAFADRDVSLRPLDG
jgi:hypothetical protein